MGRISTFQFTVDTLPRCDTITLYDDAMVRVLPRFAKLYAKEKDPVQFVKVIITITEANPKTIMFKDQEELIEVLERH